MPGFSRGGASGFTAPTDSVSIRLAAAPGMSVEQRPDRPTAPNVAGRVASNSAGAPPPAPGNPEQVWGFAGGERKAYRQGTSGFSDSLAEEGFPVERV
jgi:hypothetical protein